MNGSAVDTPRAVIVISSHVARGSVGNRAAVFALETLGHPGLGGADRACCPGIPATAGDPHRSGRGSVLRLHEGSRTRALAWRGRRRAFRLSRRRPPGGRRRRAGHRVKAKNPNALYICDPVMGDAGGLYVPEPTAEAMRDLLMPLADIATPNRYELEWIVGAQARRPAFGHRGRAGCSARRACWSPPRRR